MRTLERSGREGVGREGRRRRHLVDGRVAPADDAKRHLRIRGHCNGPPPRRRAPLGRRAVEERVTTVDDAAAWSDVAPANGTEAP